MRKVDGEDLLYPSEAAQLLRVEPKTLSNWANAGKLPCVRTMGGHRRYRRADIERLLNRPGRAVPD